MSAPGWAQLMALLVVLTALTPVVGGYMTRVFAGERVALTRILEPCERLTYRLLRVDPDARQDWKEYARSLLWFSLAGFVGLYVLLRLQSVSIFNPQHFHAGPWNLSFNTAASFVSNTSWQYYGGESTLTYLSQMAGIAVQSFLSCAVGVAVAIAVIRGFASRGSASLGNFWQDLVRGTFYVLVPVSVLGALVFVSQGSIESLGGYLNATGPTGVAQTIPLGPVASQESIKLLSGDGGGFFNVNSAMPFENPTAIANFVEMVLMLLLPAALTYTFGRMVGRRRQGWALYAAMLALFVAGAVAVPQIEAQSSPAMHAAGLHGPNLEGKEQRFGASGSALFAQVGTASGDGAVNGSMESLNGGSGAVVMANFMTGEVIFGGPGSGLFGMLLAVLLAVFLAGLMVGRTPEFLGKQIQAREMKLVAIGVLGVPLLVLAVSAFAIASHAGRQSIVAHGPQGLSETAYAYASMGFNNGSAFAAYTGFVQPNPGNLGSHGVTFADVTGGIVMLLGRFLPLIAALALAGALATKRIAPPGLGTLRTDTPTFVAFLVSTILILAVLTFVCVLFLGPLAQALTGHLF